MIHTKSKETCKSEVTRGGGGGRGRGGFRLVYERCRTHSPAGKAQLSQRPCDGLKCTVIFQKKFLKQTYNTDITTVGFTVINTQT
jgi:hypothetical protein